MIKDPKGDGHMSTIYIRKGVPSDIDDIMVVINEAKALMKAEGSPQWQAGDPNEEVILNDMENDYSYVLIVDGEIAGTACLMMDDDPSYAVIDGAWENNMDPYAAIHRIAISDKYRGQHLTDFFFSNLITISYDKGFKNMRIDTHKLNERMQYISLKHGFEYRGMVEVIDPLDPSRLAYELNLEK